MASNKKKKKGSSISSLFVLHVEKVIFALAIPAAMYIAYQGTQYKGLDWQPDVLVQASTNADKFIKSNVRKAKDEDVSVFTYDTYATWIKTKIRPDLYQTDTAWLPSLFPEKNKRGAVPVFTVHDLKASSGLGAVTISPNSPLAQERLAAQVQGAGATGSGAAGMGGTNSGGQIGERWAIITGLIPIKRQLDAYVSTFSSSVLPDPVRDTPAYFLYDVERAEVEPGKSELRWKKLDFITEWQKKKTLWASFGIDPVDPTYIAPVHRFPMAYPLPPVAKRYTEDVVHVPVIPMMTDSQVRDLKDAEKIQKRLFEEMLKVNQEDILEGDPFNGASGGGMGMSGSNMGGGMSSSDMGGTTGRNTRRQRQVAKEMEAEMKPIVVTDFLFRFLDFDVEPGKTYRYRVRLYLANPNHQLQLTYLEKDSLAKEPYLITEYSEPSNMVTIPLESRILSSDITAPSARIPWDDPLAKIMTVYFDLNDGSEWYAEKDRIFRGSACNFKKTEVMNPALSQPVSGMDGSMTEGTSPRTPTRREPARRGPAATPAAVKKEDKKTIDIVSEVCVLDMSGGQALHKTNSPTAKDVPDLKSPAKMMVLEPSGNMVIRNLNTDLAEIEQIKNPKAQTGGLSGMSGGYSGSMDSP